MGKNEYENEYNGTDSMDGTTLLFEPGDIMGDKLVTHILTTFPQEVGADVVFGALIEHCQGRWNEGDRDTNEWAFLNGGMLMSRWNMPVGVLVIETVKDRSQTVLKLVEVQDDRYDEGEVA